MNYLRFMERLLRLAVPNTAVWLAMFYLVFHLWLNILGELLMFGDRMFYKVRQEVSSVLPAALVWCGAFLSPYRNPVHGAYGVFATLPCLSVYECVHTMCNCVFSLRHGSNIAADSADFPRAASLFKMTGEALQ